ncbi:NEL-type E3 ubiquitin ligase domain-containing protein [Cupriavidus respiraculi]|nr:NEL-type E3 ubiquitin ligase domain-containing protein [Cupriavidus respiraculi]
MTEQTKNPMPDIPVFQDVAALSTGLALRCHIAAMAKGVPFRVGDLTFKIKWARDYTAAYVKPLTEGRREAGVRAVERSIASALRFGALLSAATLSVNGDHIDRATVGRHLASGGLLKVLGADGAERLLRIDWAKDGSNGKWVDVTEARLPSWRRFLRFLCHGVSGTTANRDFACFNGVKAMFDIPALARDYRLGEPEGTRDTGAPLPPTAEQRARMPLLAEQLSRLHAFFQAAATEPAEPEAAAVARSFAAWALRMVDGISAIDTGPQFEDLCSSLSLLNDLVPWVEGAESPEQRGKRLLGVSRIWACSGGSKVLDLAYFQLTSLPDSVFRHLPHLTVLKLDYNRFSSLPASISLAQGLLVIHMRAVALDDHPRITQLPDTIGDLPSLRELDLAMQRLATLPASIGRLSRLVSLGLRGNSFTAFPEALSGLNELCQVDLTANPISFAGPNGVPAMPATRARVHYDRAPQANRPVRGAMRAPWETDLAPPPPARQLRFTPKCGLSGALAAWYPDMSDVDLETLCGSWDAALMADAAPVKAQMLAEAKAEADRRVRWLPAATTEETRHRIWNSAYQQRVGSANEMVQTRTADSFAALLERLPMTAEYEDAAKARDRTPPGVDCAQWNHYVSRVQRVLEAVRQDAALRAECFQLAADGLGSCGDRVALAFNEIESQCLVHALDKEYADRGAQSLERARIEIGKKYFRARRLEESVAADLAERRGYVDEIEVRLKYQLECAGRGVDFPVPIARMLYRADVTEQQVDAAMRHIREGENDKRQLARFFAMELPFWRRHLESAYAGQFAAATVTVKEEMAALAALGADGEGSDTAPADARPGKDAAYFRRTYLQGAAAANGGSGRAFPPHHPDPTRLSEAEYADVLDAINAREQQIKADLYMKLSTELL